MPRNNNCTYAIVSAIHKYREREDALASVRRAVSQIKYLLAPHGTVEFRGEDGGSYEFNRNIGRARRSSVIQRPEGRTMETGRRGEASGILRSCVAGQGLPGRLSAFRVRDRLLASLKAGAISLSEKSRREKANKAPAWLQENRVCRLSCGDRAHRFGAITTPHRSPDAAVPKIEGNAYNNLHLIIILDFFVP